MARASLLDLEAERVAADVIRGFPCTALPICPYAIASKHEITVQTRDSSEPGVTGFLMRVGNNFAIYHASHIKNDGFIRFTVAHELGHYFLPGHPDALFPNGDGIHHSRGGFQSSDKCERQADSFASALLMPKSMFLSAIRELEPGFSAIKTLKDMARTSITATAIRYAKFAEDPVAIIISQGTTIECCFMSDVIRDLSGLQWIKKGTPLPPRCQTRTFNENASNIACSRDAAGWTSLDDWFDSAPEVEMKEDVVGLGGYGKTLTVLFTEEPLSDEDDVDSDDDE
jgi:hypothetical protein